MGPQERSPRPLEASSRSKCYVFDVARERARGGHQTAGLNKSGSSILGSQTANATPPTPATACILGDPAECLEGASEEGGHVVREAGGRMSELLDRSGTSTPVRTTSRRQLRVSAVGPNAVQHQRAVVTPPGAPATNAGVNPSRARWAAFGTRRAQERARRSKVPRLTFLKSPLRPRCLRR
jgi:hypothetical protein